LLDIPIIPVLFLFLGRKKGDVENKFEFHFIFLFSKDSGKKMGEEDEKTV